MLVLRQRRQRRDLLRLRSVWPSAIAATVLMVLPVEASSMLGLPMGKNGLPATWIGEALMVTMAFALPAVVAGVYVVAQRLARRLGKRGIVLVSLITLGTVVGGAVVDQRLEIFNELAAWTSK